MAGISSKITHTVYINKFYWTKFTVTSNPIVYIHRMITLSSQRTNQVTRTQNTQAHSFTVQQKTIITKQNNNLLPTNWPAKATEK